MNITMLRHAAVFAVKRGTLIAAKYAPYIMAGAGAVGAVAATVVACKATLELDDVVIEHDLNLERIHDSRKEISEEEYTPEMYTKDLATVYTRKALAIAKLYGPAVALGLLSLALMTGATVLSMKRYAALSAAYMVLQKAFSGYRERVEGFVGHEQERLLYTGYEAQTETVTEIVDGKKKKVEQTTITKLGHDGPSQYAVIFGEGYSTQWTNSSVHNAAFLKGQQDYLNVLLRIQGHMFLNEVYDALGMPRTPDGALVGWIYDSKDGDHAIDFGLFDMNDPDKSAFFNGYRDNVLVDFNVDGLIWSLI